MRAALVLSLLALQAAPAAADRAIDPVAVATGNFRAPRFSPDGESLLVTGPRYHGLWLVDVDAGTAREVADEPRAGLSGRFLADGRVAFEARRAGATHTLAVDGDGAAVRIDTPRPAVFAHGDRIYWRTADGVVPLGTGDRFFGPTLSPDGTRVAFIGLSTGIYVYDAASGELEHLGPGTAPAWSPDSRSLAFERTEDDGHEIVGSDIWIWRAGDEPVALARTERRIERRPAWSPDGDRIAFDDDRGAVYIVSVEVQP